MAAAVSASSASAAAALSGSDAADAVAPPLPAHADDYAALPPAVLSALAESLSAHPPLRLQLLSVELRKETGELQLLLADPSGTAAKKKSGSRNGAAAASGLATLVAAAKARLETLTEARLFVEWSVRSKKIGSLLSMTLARAQSTRAEVQQRASLLLDALDACNEALAQQPQYVHVHELHLTSAYPAQPRTISLSADGVDTAGAAAAAASAASAAVPQAALLRGAFQLDEDFFAPRARRINEPLPTIRKQRQMRERAVRAVADLIHQLHTGNGTHSDLQQLQQRQMPHPFQRRTRLLAFACGDNTHRRATDSLTAEAKDGREQLVATCQQIKQQLAVATAGLFTWEAPSALKLEILSVTTLPFPGPHSYSLPVRVALPLRELEWSELMSPVFDQPDWPTRVAQVQWREQWRKDTLRSSFLQSPRSVDAMLAQLQWLASRALQRGLAIDPPAMLLLPAVTGAWLSDSLIHSPLLSDMEAVMAQLERTGAASGNHGPLCELINLLDPLLYPLRMGSDGTLLLEHPIRDRLNACAYSGDGSLAVAVMTDHQARHLRVRRDQLSQRFAWLPTDVHVDATGRTATFRSYINNLNPLRPESAALYPLLERAFAACLPLMERTLAELISPPPPRCQPADSEQSTARRSEDAWRAYRHSEETELAAAIAAAAANSSNSSIAAASALKSAAPSRLSAELIRSLSLPDGCAVECDTVVMKRWLLRNTSTRRWEANEVTLLTLADMLPNGDALHSPAGLGLVPLATLRTLAGEAGAKQMRWPLSACYSLPACEAGAAVELRLRLYVDQYPGRWQQRFLLMHRDDVAELERNLDAHGHIHDRTAAKLGLLRLWVDVRACRFGSADLFDALDFTPRVGADPPGPSSHEEASAMDPKAAAHQPLPLNSFFSPPDDLQAVGIRAVLKQIHPDISIDEHAAGVVIEFQDRVALALLQQHFVRRDESRPSRCYWWEGVPQLEAVMGPKSTDPHCHWARLHEGQQAGAAAPPSVSGASASAAGAVSEPSTLLPAGDSPIAARFGWWHQGRMPELIRYAANEMSKAANRLREATAAAAAGSAAAAAGASTSMDLAAAVPIANLVLSHMCVAKWLRQFRSLQPEVECDLSLENSVRLLTAVEYFTAEVLELGGNAAIPKEHRRSLPPVGMAHLLQGIGNDEELMVLAAALRMNFACDPRMGTLHPGSPTDLLAELRYHRWMLHVAQVMPDERQLLQQPEPLFPFVPSAVWTEPLSQLSPARLIGRQLQVVTQLVTIRLTAESPEYSGGQWHVEGMWNERIVCTTLLVLGESNVQQSRVALRHTVSQSYRGHLAQEVLHYGYGLERGQPAVQRLGSVTLRDGRAVCWLNVLQSRLEPFRLADSTQPGYRRLLLFHLVDPTASVVSTSYVAPQQREWQSDWRREVTQQLERHTSLASVCIAIVTDYLLLDEAHSEREAARMQHQSAADEEEQKGDDDAELSNAAVTVTPRAALLHSLSRETALAQRAEMIEERRVAADSSTAYVFEKLL